MRKHGNEIWFAVAVLAATGLAVAFLAGCDAAPASTIGQRREALLGSWQLGATEKRTTWTSGKTNNLSSWKSVNCATQFGMQFLLTGLTGYKEPASNLDRFIARMEATCTQFQQQSEQTATVFTSAHRDPAYPFDVQVCPDGFDYGPFGSGSMVGEVLLTVDTYGEFVKDLSIGRTCVKNGNWGLNWAAYAPYDAMIPDQGYWGGNSVWVSCPGDDWVGTGIELRYDTQKGKIRDVRLVCRQMVWAQ